MRINKGAKVEAWTQDAASPMGAWRGGEVHWGNGHSYILRWFDGGPDSGRIPRKSVRPCPPPVALSADLAAGDMVEVFDNSLWKCAEFVCASGDGQFDVKIVGSTRVVTAGLDMLRVRQVLREDDIWVALHKGNEIPGATALPPRAIPGKQGKGKGAGNGGGKFAATPAFKWGKAKRSRCMMDAERFAGDTKRLRAKEEAARYDDNLEAIDVDQAIFLDKQQEMGSEESDDDDVDDTKSVSSSAGSSSAGGSSSSSNSGGDRAVSASSKPCEDHQHANYQPQRNCKEEHSGDRRESRVSARRHPGNEQGAVAVYQEGEVHRLELDAYTALTRAFHATGSLTWKKEELLSNLRLHLNISSDEHLQVIWDLSGRRKPARPGRP